MKRMLLLIASLMMIALFFVACRDNVSTTDSQPEKYPVSFGSYEEYLAFFSATPTADNTYCDEITNYVSSVSNDDSSLIVPCYGGQPIELRSQEGFSAISILPRELYGLLWTWFYPNSDKTATSIRISELSDEWKTLAEGKTCSEFLATVAPAAPNIDNYQNNPDYIHVYEDEFAVNGEEVCALIQETVDGTTYISFVSENCLICISSPSGAITESWLEELSFVELSKDTAYVQGE